MQADLKLDRLRRIAREEKFSQDFRQEIMRVFGSPVGLGGLSSIAENACDIVYEDHAAKIRTEYKQFDPRLVEQAMSMSHLPDSAKKLAVRLLPESKLPKYARLGIKDIIIKREIAKRIPLEEVKRFLKESPRDHVLRMIYEEKSANTDTEISIALGDAVKSTQQELTDGWYDRLAKKIYDQFGRMRDDNWEEIAVQQVAMNYASTTDQKIDSVKLMQSLRKLQDERDEYYVNENFTLLGLVQALREEADREIPVLVEEIDPTESLKQSQTFNRDFSRKFNVRFEKLPGKYTYFLAEGADIPMVPRSGKFPSDFSRKDAIEFTERFLKSWSKKHHVHLKMNLQGDKFTVVCEGVH